MPTKGYGSRSGGRGTSRKSYRGNAQSMRTMNSRTSSLRGSGTWMKINSSDTEAFAARQGRSTVNTSKGTYIKGADYRSTLLRANAERLANRKNGQPTGTADSKWSDRKVRRNFGR